MSVPLQKARIGQHPPPTCFSRHATIGVPELDTFERLGEREIAGIRAQTRVMSAVVRLRGARSGTRQPNKRRDQASPKPARRETQWRSFPHCRCSDSTTPARETTEQGWPQSE